MDLALFPKTDFWFCPPPPPALFEYTRVRSCPMQSRFAGIGCLLVTRGSDALILRSAFGAAWQPTKSEGPRPLRPTCTGFESEGPRALSRGTATGLTAEAAPRVLRGVPVGTNGSIAGIWAQTIRAGTGLSQALRKQQRSANAFSSC